MLEIALANPIPHPTVRWRCPHCRKTWAYKARVAAHIPYCFADPLRRTCKTCRHDEWPRPGCELGLDQGPSCTECGKHPEVCGHFERRAATQLRVLCPQWEPKE